MTIDDGPHSKIWIDGVELAYVYSGDVTAAEEAVRKAIAQGDSWFTIPYEGGSYTLHVDKSTSVIVSYV